MAAGFCPLALGTQTIGSICRPAAFCGVVGFKTSYDRIPRDGVIPLSPSLDHVGTFTSDVAGAALAAGVLVDGWRRPQPAARRPVLGIPEGPYLERADPDGLAGLGEAVALLEAGGYRVERLRAFHAFEAIERRHRLIVAAEASRVHAGWYERWADRYHPKTVELIEAGRRVAAVELAEALAGREILRGELAALAESESVDLWISPAAPGPAPLGLESTGDPVMNLPWTHAGLPSVALPCGNSADGLPLGLQLVAGWRRDEELLAWARGIEEALADGR